MEPDDLRRWLAENGYTRERLAFTLEVNPTTVYRWLNGSIAIPKTTEIALRALGEEAGKESR